jgi:hypothetical protein
MRTMELYYNDLTPEAQKRYLKVQGVSDASDLNWEVSPVAIIEVEEERDNLDPDLLKKGTFTSVWDDGAVIQTEATLNTKSGHVDTTALEGDNDHGSLEREYFTDQAGKEYEICVFCHEYILKTAMVDSQVGIGLVEIQTCSDPDCDSH